MSNMTKNAFLLLALCSALFMISCGDDDDVSQDCTTGDFTFQLNDTLWTGVDFNNTLIFGADPTTGLEARRCDIRATNAEGDQIILTFSNNNASDDSCMETGAYVAPANVGTSGGTNVFFFTYISASGSLTFSTFDGTMSVSSCDEDDNRTMEGTFTFSDPFEDNIGTGGSFKVCFPE